MRIFTYSVLAAIGLVLALALLANVSERSASEHQVAIELPATVNADALDRDNSPSACLLPPPATTSEALGEAHDLPCTPRVDGVLSMDIQRTQC